jgi:uncharacterized protein YbcV (DUF1398 family)
MTEQQANTARACLYGAAHDTMDFPGIVGALMAAGFESYAVDFRRGLATYFLPSGEALELAAHPPATPIAPALDDTRLRAAIGEAQRKVPGYTYAGFCEKAAAAGCAAYIVSFTGRRALYIGRTAETHVEHFPT